MEVEEVKQAIQAKRKIQIIDVRSKEEYEIGHIPHAASNPSTAIVVSPDC